MAYNQNPEKAEPTKSWNSSSQDDRLGFALRDKRTTEAISTPMVIPKMGYSYQTYMSHYPTPVVGVSRQNMASWVNNRVIDTIPGILTLDFEPIYALSDPNARAETADLFINVYTYLRVLNNMTKNFQGQDIQIMFCALMELKMHIANLRRILNIMKTVVNHELNEYYFGQALVKALGFDISEQDMRWNWEKWWQFYNVSILGKLRKVRWFTDVLVPGQNRWAGMCKEIYKDNPAFTDYCQVYMFKPRYFNMMWSAWDSEQSLYLWQFEKQKYQQSDVTPEVSGAVAFEAYLEKVFTLLNNVFYDDSAADIIATLNAVVERNLSSENIKAEYIDIPEIPFEGEEVKLTYDFNTLIAIHNATICNVDVHEPTQNVQLGVLEQNVTIPIDRAASLRVQLFPKIVNMPNFGATTTDMINATQWTLVNQPYGLSSEVVYLRPGSIGTEVLTRLTIWSNKYNQITGTYALSPLDMSSSAWLIGWPDGVPVETTWNALSTYVAFITELQNFAFAPILYNCDAHDATDRKSVV